jgi:hypothetical protein
MPHVPKRVVLGLLTLGYKNAAGGCRQYANRPWDPSNPTAYWVGRASAYTNRKPLPSNTWLLHPWLPVDIRLPMLAGVLGAAAYIYLERTDRLGAPQGNASSLSEAVKSWMSTAYQYVATPRDNVLFSPSKGAEGSSTHVPGGAAQPATQALVLGAAGLLNCRVTLPVPGSRLPTMLPSNGWTTGATLHRTRMDVTCGIHNL